MGKLLSGLTKWVNGEAYARNSYINCKEDGRKITEVGREAWYDWNGGKLGGPPTENTNQEMNEAACMSAKLSQGAAKIPDRLGSHLPKGIPSQSPPAMNETKPLLGQRMASGEIDVRLKEMLRFQKQIYNRTSVCQGYVRISEILQTTPTNEMLTQEQNIEQLFKQDPSASGGEKMEEGGIHTPGAVWAPRRFPSGNRQGKGIDALTCEEVHMGRGNTAEPRTVSSMAKGGARRKREDGERRNELE